MGNFHSTRSQAERTGSGRRAAFSESFSALACLTSPARAEIARAFDRCRDATAALNAFRFRSEFAVSMLLVLPAAGHSQIHLPADVALCAGRPSSPKIIAAELADLGWAVATPRQTKDSLTSLAWLTGLNTYFWEHGPDRTHEFWHKVESHSDGLEFTVFGSDVEFVVLTNSDESLAFVGGVRFFDEGPTGIKREVCAILHNDPQQVDEVISSQEDRFKNETPASKSTRLRFITPRGPAFADFVIFKSAAFHEFGERAPKYAAVSRQITHAKRAEDQNDD